MEGLTLAGQEEYIWAMRVSINRDDSEEWKKRRSVGSGKNVLKSKSFTDTLAHDYQTKLMAALVPDEVITNANDYSHRKYDACFLFGDVSGFTELCEKYTKLGVSGPSRMTQVLNKYLGSMVQEVLSHSGDVLKFSGDAFLAMFKTTEDTPMRDAVHEALDASLVIQKNYGSYLTDVGVVIRVKLAISAGPVTLALIGDENNSHYVVVGNPIWEVKAAECASSAGDIIVAPAAWHYVNTAEYIYNEVSNGTYIKLTGVGPNWRSIQKNVGKRQKSKDEDEGSIRSSLDSDDSDEEWQTATLQTDEFSLRPAVNVAVRMKIKEPLRKFILKPLMKSIDNDEPFEYLSEMRQAVIAVINVVSAKLENAETVILADQSYKIVCSVVDKMKGCVNKVSLFDKDLMFVVIFGLRGLKHELECQVALRCAKQCHESINKLPGVLSASIGVTTGKTYCGVFGHTLRREYTVISLTVNKAARLMVNYKGKVTCDRDTFLHSKLEARYFILQPYKPLKGISHPGPVYEYREADLDQDVFRKINPRPLLGHQDSLKAYLKLLDEFLSPTTSEEDQIKMVLIKGNARSGKTRLLDEIVFITPTEIPINRVTLRDKDANKPYQCIKLLFELPLGLDTNSPVKEKESKIIHIFKDFQAPDLLCLFNEIFGTGFPNSRILSKLNDHNKKQAIFKIIKQLCYLCFPTLWVFIIDNSEYMDKESCHVITTLLDVPTIFMVVTMNREKLDQGTHSLNIFDDPRIKRMPLKPIERCYLGALACHILDVYAISPELEHAIQGRSNGNPGWIESLLISLIQDEALYILPASLTDINDLGLVAPPLYMMARLSKDEAFKWQHMLEEKKQESASLSDLQHWQRYIDTCRDSYMNITIRELLENLKTGVKVPVCIISPSFHVGDEDIELSADALILKTFDSLTFFEQLLCKCSAILGNQFLKDMMLYVMNCSDKRKTALAIKKLFEIRVFTCAKGDFLDTGTRAFKEKLLDPNDEITLDCKCRGVKIDETCLDLPKYASCGYLQFKSSLHRDITYSLLTDNQKKEFHQRAIRFLERETRKCQSCGNGFFEQILGERQDKDFLKDRDKQQKIVKDDLLSMDTVSFSRRGSEHSVGTNYSSGSGSRKKFDEKSVAGVSAFSNVTLPEKPTLGSGSTAMFGFRMINKLKNSYSLTRTFSNSDFTDCQCALILSTTYAQLVEHCIGADDLIKTIEAMIEYAHVSIVLFNIPLALKTLKEALDVLSEREKQEEFEWKISLIRGKIYTLLGFARMQSGQHDVAFEYLHDALAEYKIRFPATDREKKFKNFKHTFKQSFAFYIFPRSIMKSLNHYDTIYANSLAECLGHLCNIYIRRNEWQNAEVAASWCLQKALESFSNFQVICTAFAHALNISKHLHRWKFCTALEVHALKICHMKKTAMEVDDMKCVAKLYAMIFSARLMRTEIDKSIHMGFIVMRICSSVQAVGILFAIIPPLIHGLLVAKHFRNAFSVLQELEFLYVEDVDSSGKVWYLALCMSIQLETGYSVLSYDTCENYYQVEGDSWLTIRDPAAKKRFFTAMWLWCIRHDNWEEGTIWYLKTREFAVIKTDDTEPNYITALYLLEGMIIFLVSKLDKRNVQAIFTVECEIKMLFKILKKAAKTFKVLLPRIYHLEAYYKNSISYDADIERLINKVHKTAMKLGNELELGWVDHNSKAWHRALPSIQIDLWKEHTESDNLLEFSEIETNEGKPIYFTLPLPVFI